MNSAWGLALDNLYFVVDWNDFGIDEHPVSSAVYGSPADWFGSHGWRVFGTEEGSDWRAVTTTLLEMTGSANPQHSPNVTWLRTRKGRGYLKYDAASHGAPHKMNCELFWETKSDFAERYGCEFRNYAGEAPGSPDEMREEFAGNLEAVIDVLRQDQGLVDYLADRLVALGDSVPNQVAGFRLAPKSPFSDERLYDYRSYPADIYAKPGASLANRNALAKWGAWVNALGARDYGRPLFLAASADLAESTNISGFAKTYGDFPGYGWYERYGSPEGALLPQEITEFANAGIMAGVASVNFAEDPETEFDGFWGACSTYGSFSYLKYGPLRLFSQMAQDCQWKLGKVSMDCRALGTGNSGRQPYSLRHLLAWRDAIVPEGPSDQPASVGVQRGAGAARGGPQAAGADRGAAPDASGHRHAGPRGAGDAVPLRGRAWRLRGARLPQRSAHVAAR